MLANQAKLTLNPGNNGAAELVPHSPEDSPGRRPRSDSPQQSMVRSPESLSSDRPENQSAQYRYDPDVIQSNGYRDPYMAENAGENPADAPTENAGENHGENQHYYNGEIEDGQWRGGHIETYPPVTGTVAGPSVAGTAAGPLAPLAAPPLTGRAARRRKLELMRRFAQLRDRGYEISQYCVEDDLVDMEQEYDVLQSMQRRENSKMLYKGFMLNVVGALEFLNDNYNPFDFNMTGWHQHEEQRTASGTYDDVFEEIVDKYKGTGKQMEPELRLLLMMMASGATFHANNQLANGEAGLSTIAGFGLGSILGGDEKPRRGRHASPSSSDTFPEIPERQMRGPRTNGLFNSRRPPPMPHNPQHTGAPSDRAPNRADAEAAQNAAQNAALNAAQNHHYADDVPNRPAQNQTGTGTGAHRTGAHRTGARIEDIVSSNPRPPVSQITRDPIESDTISTSAQRRRPKVKGMNLGI